MFKINRNRRLNLKRLTTFFMSAALVFALAGMILGVSRAYDTVSADASMHFIVRHWHLVEDTNTSFQGDLAVNNGYYFVVAEGYIKPADGAYKIYLAYQSDSDDHQTGDLEEITNETNPNPAYIADIDTTNGAITLKANPIESDEHFTAFSVSAGHTAVSEDDTSLTITYNPYVRLVKAHAFYSQNDAHELVGSDADIFTAERDTAIVDGQTVYSTVEGIHTNKNITATDDDREFNLNLETWYAEGYDPQVGMVIDASGSMAFTSDTPTAIVLTDEQLAALEINKLPSATGNGEPTGGWDNYFLTKDQLDQVLDKRKTDNSLLGVSGYSYYVYDSADSTKEFAPLAYWEGIGAYSFAEDTDTDVTTNWPSAHSDLQMSDTLGITVAGKAGDNKVSSNGIVLDAVPTNGQDFSISFKYSTANTGDPSSNADAKQAELIYVGPMSGTLDQTPHYRLFRAGGGSWRRLQGTGIDAGNYITNINNTFFPDVKGTVTLVFSGNTVTTYVNCENGGSAACVNESKTSFSAPLSADDSNRIIINGSVDSYNGMNIYIDDVYVFDRALNSTEAADPTTVADDSLIGKYLFNKGGSDTDSTYREWLLNSATNTFASKLTQQGSFSTATNTALAHDGSILGTINSENATNRDTLKTAYIDAGWYYLSHDNWVAANMDFPTSKRLIGLPGNSEVTGSIVLPNNGGTVDNGYSYNTASDSPLKFYVDSDGHLCTLFARSATVNAGQASYVYELSDSEYTKVEALQRVIGMFGTELNYAAPDARVSAVRFSSGNYTSEEYRKRLVMLDWSNDPSEIANIFSLKRGNGDSNTSTTSASGLEQYNYSLTGGTSTDKGLQSFIENLLPNDGPSTAPKVLILFTDGTDSDGTSSQASTYAEAIKDAGYTIFTVLIDGGPVAEGQADYNKAHDFLLGLSGNSDTTTDAQKENYFYSVSKSKRVLEGKDVDTSEMNNADILTATVVEDVIQLLVQPLDSYDVKEYIDPRFDLVDGDGKVWYLGADGVVTDESGDIIVSRSVKLANAYEGAETPTLHFDEAEHMYYLLWESQTIPTSSVGATSISAWNAQISLRAKDDLVGGNAILTDGYAEGMNMVYHHDDESAKSGTTTATKIYAEDGAVSRYPSKGFPRNFVNIAPTAEDVTAGQSIYLGETLDLDLIKQKLLDATQSSDELAATTKYFWEYLIRYAASGKDERSLEELISAITEDGLEIPYYYISDVAAVSDDLLGYISYSFAEPGEVTVSFKPLPESAEISGVDLEPTTRTEANQLLIAEEAYQWDAEIHPAVGTVATEDEISVGTYNIDRVNGEIQLQLKLDAEEAKLLKGTTVEYSADLMREYADETELAGTFSLILEDFDGEPGIYTAEFQPAVADTEEELTDGEVTDETADDFAGFAIGIYTLDNIDFSFKNVANSELRFEFNDTVALAADDEAYADTEFTIGTGYDDEELAEKYVATIDENSIILGDYEAADYLDTRFGLYQTSVSYRIVKTPKTLDDTNIVAWIVVISTLGAILTTVAYVNRKSKDTTR